MYHSYSTALNANGQLDLCNCASVLKYIKKYSYSPIRYKCVILVLRIIALSYMTN
jgi:hypothetical protein